MKRVRLVGNGVAGSPFYWNFYFDPGNVDSDPADCANWVAQFFFGFRTHWGSSLVLTGDQEVARIDPATGDILDVESVPPFGAGGLGTDLLPTVVQGLIRWNTGVFNNGRRLIGHTFLPTPPESDNTVAGIPAATYNAAVAQEVLDADALDPTIVQCIWSRRYGVAATRTGFTVNPGGKWSYLKSRRD